MITCPRCGYQAPDGTLWCPRCGYGKPQTQNPQPAGQIPQPRQAPEIPQRPPDPLPERPEQKKKSTFGGNCLAIILMVVFLILVVIMVVAIGKSRSKPKPTPTPTLDMTATSEALESAVLDMLEQRMAETMNAAISVEPTETKTPVPTNTPIPVPEGYTLYTVQEGDSCYSIWTEFGMGSDLFFSVNSDLPKTCPINIGDQVIVPDLNQESSDTDYESYCGNMLKIWQFSVDQEKYSGSMTQDSYDSDRNACRYTLSGTSSAGSR